MMHKTGLKILGLLLIVLLVLGAFVSSINAEKGSIGAVLEIGEIVNNKMRLLSTVFDSESKTEINLLKAIRMADLLPDSFIPSEKNTVSVADSMFPVYIFFDNENDAGIMYFYTEGDRIVMNSNSARLFSGYSKLTDISGVAEWDASQVTNMYAMFAGDKSLPDALALRNWDTSSVTDMSYMFTTATSLKYIDVSNWDTSNVLSMACMFQVGESWKGNGELSEILGIGSLDVSNVKNMTCMFYGAGKMTYYDIADWNVSNVESMNHMFGDNFCLRSLDLSRWDVSSVKTIYCMFDDNHALKTIGDVSHWNTVSLIDGGAWLNDAIVFVGNNEGVMDLSGWDTSNLKAAGEMFLGTKIRILDLSGWNFDSVTNDSWEGAGRGIYYEYGNGFGESLQGFGQMFGTMWKLSAVYISQSTLDSYNSAVERGVNTDGMWLDSTCTGFTVK